MVNVERMLHRVIFRQIFDDFHIFSVTFKIHGNAVKISTDIIPGITIVFVNSLRISRYYGTSLNSVVQLVLLYDPSQHVTMCSYV